MENFEKVKRFIQGMLEEVNVGHTQSRVAMVTYGTQARVEFYLSDYDSRVSIQEAIEALPYYRGSSNTAAALKVRGQ